MNHWQYEKKETGERLHKTVLLHFFSAVTVLQAISNHDTGTTYFFKNFFSTSSLDMPTSRGPVPMSASKIPISSIVYNIYPANIFLL